ncbi:hypothetical protein ES705_41083 [subsurface metagenome]
MCYLFCLKYTNVSIVYDPLTKEHGYVDTPGLLFESDAFKIWGHIKTYGLIILQYFTGIISEAFYSGTYDWYNAQYDLESVNHVLSINNICHSKIDTWVLAERLVIKHWGLIDHLAKFLLVKKELTNLDVEKLLQGIKITLHPPALKDL